MAATRTPQRVRKLTRYFESVLDSTTASATLKMRAAERLAELFLETERGKRERQIAIARAQARVEQAALEKTAQSTNVSSEATAQPDPQAEIERDGLNRVAAFMESFKKSA